MDIFIGHVLYRTRSFRKDNPQMNRCTMKDFQVNDLVLKTSGSCVSNTRAIHARETARGVLALCSLQLEVLEITVSIEKSY